VGERMWSETLSHVYILRVIYQSRTCQDGLFGLQDGPLLTEAGLLK
jgi:hypothetical protein